MRRTVGSRKPLGVGIWNGEGMGRDGEGEISLRATWDQGGQDRITPKEGFQVCKGNGREVNRELERGVKRGIAP